MSQINAIVVGITLDGHNYPEWAFCVETALRGYGLYFHLTDDPPTPETDPSNSAAIQTWEINDGKVMAAMVNSVKQSMIMKFATAKAIWSHLKERYVQDSGALLHTLMQQTHAIEQNDMTIDEYYSAFDRLVGSLTSMGVREEFDSIRKRLLHDSSDLTMARALSDLLAEETRLRSMSAPMSVPHSILAASQRYNAPPKGTSLEPCKHCGKTNHSSENCFSRHPEKLADFRARRAARAARGRGTGSTPRGSVSIAAALPISAPQSSWVLDSGASFHVTSDHSQLVASKPVADGASIRTADGSSNRGCDWDWPSP